MNTHVHHPAPRGVVWAGVVFLLLLGVPSLVMQPDVQSVIVFAVFAALAVALSLLAFARVECRSEGGQLRLHQVRTPLPARDLSFALGDIARIDVRRVGRQSRQIVLVFRDGREEYFPGGGSSASSHEATAEVLRGWLGR